jgi:hypothetical protein
MGSILISRAPMGLHCHVKTMTTFSSSRIMLMATDHWVCNGQSMSSTPHLALRTLTQLRRARPNRWRHPYVCVSSLLLASRDRFDQRKLNLSRQKNIHILYHYTEFLQHSLEVSTTSY